MWCTNIEYDTSHKAREFFKDEILIDNLIAFLDELVNRPIDQQWVVNAFRNLFSYERGNKGFHRWGGLKYFLFDYEENLRKEYKETNNKVSISDFHDTQIEHIMPKAWSDFWKEEMKEFINMVDEDKEPHSTKVLLNTLGNLTILGAKNQPLQNKPWNSKKEWFSTGSYNEIEISKFDKWGYNSIRDRGMKMLKYLCDKVQNGFTFDENTMQQILFDADYIIKEVYK
jgi:hypothetical protein